MGSTDGYTGTNAPVLKRVNRSLTVPPACSPKRRASVKVRGRSPLTTERLGLPLRTL